MAETILIVDDDPVQRRLLEAMARASATRSMTAEGGDAAVAARHGARTRASTAWCSIS